MGTVLNRIKLAALLGDVILEDGMYRIQAGPGGAFAATDFGVHEDEDRWQTPRERGFAERHQFIVTAQEDGAAQSFEAINSEATISWWATYGPIKRQLRRPYDWIEITRTALTKDQSEAAKELQGTEYRAGLLPDESVPFVRSRILEHVSVDTVAAISLDAALVMDRRHSGILTSRLETGRATRVAAAEAVRVLEPNWGVLDWDDIDRLRVTKGWSELRDVWTEIGEFALQFSGSSAELVDNVHRSFEDRLVAALVAADGPKGPRRWAGTALGFVAGGLANLAGLTPVSGLAAEAASTALSIGIDWSQKLGTPRWLAAHSALRDSIHARLGA